MLRIQATAPLRPTEDVTKVARALANLFPELRVEVRAEAVVGETDSLDRLRDLVRNQKIRDTARSQLRQARQGDRITISLSKQAAYAGRVNFSASSPLGDIEIVIEADDPDAVIDFVAESTVEPKG